MAEGGSDDDTNSAEAAMVTADKSNLNEPKFPNFEVLNRLRSNSSSSFLNESCDESESDLVIDTNSCPASPHIGSSNDCIDLTNVTNGFSTRNQYANDSDSYKCTNINGPLNLSIGSEKTRKKNETNISNQQFISALKTIIETNQSSDVSHEESDGNHAIIPQLILTSGKLINSLQQADIFIPTSEGLISQTVLTIPISHVNSNHQMVNVALSNGQNVTTSVANLQAMTKSQQQLLFNDFVNSTKVTNRNGFNTNNHQKKFPDNDKSVFKENQHQQFSAKHNGRHDATKPSLNGTPTELTISTNPSQNHHLLNPINNNNNNKNHINHNNNNTSISPTIPNLVNHASSKAKFENNSSMDLLIDSPNQPTITATPNSMMDGINLDEVKEFAKAFKVRRLSLGLTQSQVGQAMNVTEGPTYSQSAICSALASQMLCATQLSNHPNQIFEKLDITPKSAEKIKPVLEKWMKEAEDRYHSGHNHLTEFMGLEQSKKRKRRTSFTPQALELLNAHFERNTHPSGTEITSLAHQLGYDREVIRIWFCNKRQALKNTVRMMSKSVT